MKQKTLRGMRTRAKKKHVASDRARRENVPRHILFWFFWSGSFYYFRTKRRKKMKITLKDGSVKEYASPMSIIDIAKDISEGLARVWHV